MVVVTVVWLWLWWQNKNQAEKVSAARKQVAQWVKEGRELAGLPDMASKGTALCAICLVFVCLFVDTLLSQWEFLP